MQTITLKQAVEKYKISSETIDDLAMQVLNKYGNMIVADCKKNTNVITGYGRRSWRLEPAHKEGDNILALICNDVSYMFFVEKGHRTRNGGWVEGQFIADKAIRRFVPQMAAELEQKVRKLIEEGKKG